MKKFGSKITTAILLSFVINAPFAIGEFLTRDVLSVRTEFPVALFAGLWILTAVFAYLLMLVMQTFRNDTVSKKPTVLTIQIFILGVIAWAWAMLIIDQWPCFFLGGSGC
jgi:uncharacterized protein with LGFP repeats